jgi:Type II secretory pathway, component HofQ
MVLLLQSEEILEKTEDVKDSGVPGLMNIPILGYLFKEKYQQEKTNELLIFLSPKIYMNSTSGEKFNKSMSFFASLRMTIKVALSLMFTI